MITQKIILSEAKEKQNQYNDFISADFQYKKIAVSCYACIVMPSLIKKKKKENKTENQILNNLVK